MIQCKDCEFFSSGPNGEKMFRCDPFSNIKEAECLMKWQLMRLDMLVAGYRGMNQMQSKMAPLQEKLFKYMKRELEDLDETDSWKYDEEDDEGLEL